MVNRDEDTYTAAIGPLPALPVISVAGTVTDKPAARQLQGLNHSVNGKFDIVLIQSSVDDSLPAGALGGKPVYTVYLRIGDTADWIMHYCAGNSGVVQKGGVVELPDPRPLDAPYPRVTFRPDEAPAGPNPYILVHGAIDENGAFQSLKVIGSSQPDRSSSLLATLSRWKFRPAMRAGSPEKIEMVLAIPVPQGSHGLDR